MAGVRWTEKDALQGVDLVHGVYQGISGPVSLDLLSALVSSGAVYASLADAQQATIPVSLQHVLIAIGGRYFAFARNAAGYGVTLGGESWCAPAGHKTYLQHFGLVTYETEAACEAAGAAMTAQERTDQQTALASAMLNTDGELYIDGYIEAFDTLIVGTKCTLDQKGGIDGRNLEAGIYVSSRFNLSAAQVVQGGVNGGGAKIRSLHVAFNQDAAAASGVDTDIIRYPVAFRTHGTFGELQNFRAVRCWTAIAPDTNNGGWKYGNLQTSCLWDWGEIGNEALHFVGIERIDDWVWDMNQNLQDLRTRIDSIEGRARRSFELTRCDNATVDYVGGFRAGDIIVNRGTDSAITDQIVTVQVDGDYTQFVHQSGRTTVGKLYATDTIGAPNLPYKVKMVSGYLSIADGSIVGDAQASIDAEGGTLKYSGIIRNTSVNGHLIRARPGSTVILEGVTFVIENAQWQVPPIWEEDGATIIIRDCKAQHPDGTPVNLWRLVGYENRSAESEMDAPPASRADMVTALAGSTQFQFEAKGGETYMLDGLTYLGVDGATAIPDLPGLVAIDPDLKQYGGATQTAVDAMLAQEGIVTIRSPISVAADVTIGGPVVFKDDAYLVATPGVTITYQGAVTAPRAHVFRGNGDHVFAAGTTHNLTPYHFGAVGDYTTDDTAALQAWLAAGRHLSLDQGVFACVETTLEPLAGTHITGAGAARIEPMNQRDDVKDLLRPGFKDGLPGSVIVFKGSTAVPTVATGRSGTYETLRPVIYYDHKEPATFEGFTYLLDVDLLDAAGNPTPAASDNRQTAYDCGLVSKGYSVKMRDVCGFGYLDRDGMCIVYQEEADDIPDPDYFRAEHCAFTSGFAVIGSTLGSSSTGGITGVTLDDCNVYNALTSDRAETNPATHGLRLDADTTGTNSGGRGFTMRGGMLRCAGTLGLFENCDDVSLEGVTIERVITGNAALDNLSPFVATAETSGTFTMDNCSSTATLYLANIAVECSALCHFRATAEVSGYVIAKGGAGTPADVRWSRMDATAGDDPYALFATGVDGSAGAYLFSENLGWRLRDDGDGTFKITHNGSLRLQLGDGGDVRFPNLPQYADDAAAATGGLDVGDTYVNSTTGALTQRLA